MTIVGALLTFPYFLTQQEVLYSAMFWQFSFVVINLVHVVLLVRARKPIPLTDEERLIKNMVFRNFTTRETRKILDLSSLHHATTSETIILENTIPDKLYLVRSGSAHILQNDRLVAHRSPGAFLGELSFLEEKAAVANVMIDRDTSVLVWDRMELKQLLDKNDGIKTAFLALLSANVAEKLSDSGLLAR